MTMAESSQTITGSKVFASGGAPKVVSMKLFASWEIDKTSSSCIPRLCMFSVTGLQITPSLIDEEVRSVILAVQMAGSKRVLRSGEIPLSTDAHDTPLDISFSMQYAHFLKRDDNNLRVALQRRKKYKNRTFLGYKTLAGGTINLSQVLQRPKDLNLDLYSALSKEKEKVVAVVTLQNISSKPVSYDDGKTMSLSGMDRSPESDEDDDIMEEDGYPDESCSDEEAPNAVRGQTNFKQKIARLLRRFKSSDDAEKQILKALEGEQSAQGNESANFDELFDGLEDLSDESENEHDNISVRSIRKPTLPLYFDETVSIDTLRRDSLEKDTRILSTQSSLVEQSGPELTGQTPHDQDDVFSSIDTSIPLIDGVGNEAVLDTVQLSKVFKDSTHSLPKVLYIVDERVTNSYYTVAHTIYLGLNKASDRATLRVADKEEFSEMVKQMSLAIESFCNNNSRTPSISLVLVGSDSFYNQALVEFTQVFSQKSPDWLNYVKFIPIPISKSNMGWELSRVDPLYHQLFSAEAGWQRLIDKSLQSTIGDCDELIDRIYKYEGGASSLMQYPVSEAMISLCSTKDSDESQHFVPFLTEVLLGNLTTQTPAPTPVNIPGASDGEDVILSTSPAHKDIASVSSSTEKPSVSSSLTHQTSSPPGSAGSDTCELQIEYFLPNKSGDKSKGQQSKESKETLKGFFKYIQVRREKNSFRLIAVSREKRGKMIRLGKKSKDKSKEKEADSSKNQSINRDGIIRIVCTVKDSSDQLTVHLDDVEHHGVQFFQLSTQWQTHVKHLPVAVSKQYQAYD